MGCLVIAILAACLVSSVPTSVLKSAFKSHIKVFSSIYSFEPFSINSLILENDGLIYVVWATRYQGRRSLGRLGRDRSRQQYLSHRFHDGFRCVPIIALRSGPSRVRSWSTPRSAPCVFLYLLSPWVEIGPVLPFPFLVREDSRLTRTPSSSVLAVERVLSGFWVLLLPLICEHC